MNKIKELRQIANISQAVLAEKMGVSQQTVSQWENNITDPVAKKLPEIAELFGCKIDDLFKEE